MANYTINEIPTELTDVANADSLVIYDDSRSKTARISAYNLMKGKQDSLTFDNAPTENSNNPVKSGGIYEAIANVSGSSAIVASSTTLTGATLTTNQILRIFFSADITGSDTSTALTISYNDTSYPVMAHKNSALVSVYAHEVSSGVYKYLQAYTTLEVIFDGTQFVIVGNPIVLSSDNYTIYADGLIEREWERLYDATTDSTLIVDKKYKYIILVTPYLGTGVSNSTFFRLSDLTNGTTIDSYLDGSNRCRITYTGLNDDGNYLFNRTLGRPTLYAK